MEKIGITLKAISELLFKGIPDLRIFNNLARPSVTFKVSF